MKRQEDEWIGDPCEGVGGTGGNEKIDGSYGKRI
jgi:hypothetical protein